MLFTVIIDIWGWELICRVTNALVLRDFFNGLHLTMQLVTVCCLVVYDDGLGLSKFLLLQATSQFLKNDSLFTLRIVNICCIFIIFWSYPDWAISCARLYFVCGHIAQVKLVEWTEDLDLCKLVLYVWLLSMPRALLWGWASRFLSFLQWYSLELRNLRL